MLKRSFDVFCSFFGLLVLLPVFACVALWIKLDSKGPIFFRQVRVGRYGVPFRIHKFRSMAVNAESKGKLTIGADSRITRSGQFIRKTKLDELPQLIDVFSGKMSLVGPRPEVAEFIELYSELERSKILSVRPGITDRASIEMVDENEILGKYKDARQAYIDVIMPIKARFYCDYVNNQSFLEDLKIIIITIRTIVFGRA